MGVRWTEEEDAILRGGYRGDVAAIAPALPGRTGGAIRRRAMDLGLTPPNGRTRRGARVSPKDRRRFYGRVPSRTARVVVPLPLYDWIDSFAAQRGISLSALLLECIEVYTGQVEVFAAEEWGVTLPPLPGQYEIGREPARYEGEGGE